MPDLSRILNLIEQLPVYGQLLEGLKQRHDGTVVMLDAAKPYLIAALYHTRQLPILVITAQPENSRKLYEQLSTWCGFNNRLKLFPEPEALPYEFIARYLH